MEAFQAHRKWLQKLIITLEATLNLKKKNLYHIDHTV